jgi:hypothetical protein
MVERDNDEQLPEEMPASATHRLPDEEWELERVQLSKEKVMDFIHRVQERPNYYATHFELDLEKMDLLADLEEAGVLPVVKPKNEPTSPPDDTETEQVDDGREKVLNNIYMGTVIGNLFGEIFSRK